jgi:RNA polymerase sigma-70 factor (ECF subfamily)
MAMETATDEKLVRRHLEGDPDAYGQLIERYTGRLYNLAFRFAGNREEAEDLVQEAFLHAYIALPRSHTDMPFKPWIFQILVNLCRDQARKKRPLLFSELSTPDQGESPVEIIPDTAATPDDQAEEEELETALRSAVLKLPQEERMILTLRYNEGLSYDELGKMFDIPTATVGTLLFRAKRNLQAALADFVEVEK